MAAEKVSDRQRGSERVGGARDAQNGRRNLIDGEPGAPVRASRPESADETSRSAPGAVRGLQLQTHRVRWTFVEPILGTVPKDRGVYATYIQTKNAEKGTPLADRGDEVETVPEAATDEERGWTGFHADAQGDFLFDYMVQGYLREAANAVKEPLGVKALRSKMENCVWVGPRRLYLHGTRGEPLERPLRAMTAQGPRVTLRRSDQYLAGTTMTFAIKLLTTKEITWDGVLVPLMDLGVLRGFGQWRTGGYGRFTWEEVAP